MKINKLEIENVKRIKAVRLKPALIFEQKKRSLNNASFIDTSLEDPLPGFHA